MVDGMAGMPLSDDAVRLLYSGSVLNALTGFHWGERFRSGIAVVAGPAIDDGRLIGWMRIGGVRCPLHGGGLPGVDV